MARSTTSSVTQAHEFGNFPADVATLRAQLAAPQQRLVAACTSLSLLRTMPTSA